MKNAQKTNQKLEYFLYPQEVQRIFEQHGSNPSPVHKMLVSEET